MTDQRTRVARARLTPTEAELVDAIAEDLEQKHCPECGGVGTVCLFCDQTIDECNCGTDSEPVPCEACNGSGMVALAEGED